MLLAGLACGSAAFAQVLGSGPGRFVDLVELTDHDDQADIVVQFTCALRYLTHQPASEGKELRIQLQPQGECGLAPGTPVPGELPPLSGGANIIAAARVDSDVPGQVTLALTFIKAERYVLVQGIDPRSMRVRLIDRARGRGKVMVNEPGAGVSSYAINLESQPKEFDPAAVALAHDRLKLPAFVSEAVVDGTTWYRLRVGPVDKRSDADRLLNQAVSDYPRAWIAMGDDSATSQGGGGEALPAVERIGADAALDPAAQAKLVADARAAMTARDYPRAIGLLTKLQRQPEFPQRAAMQELLGLARERAGQLAHAKAEYEEYLRRYPTGEAADRVARRLAVLRAASTQARTGSGGGQASTGWNLSGGFGQSYRTDSTSVTNSSTSVTPVPTDKNKQSQNALYNDFDMLVRRRGERFDFSGRVSAGYAKNFGGVTATSNGDSLKRVSIASFEMADRQLGILARLGRQTHMGGGVLGSFDGLYTAWQIAPAIAVNFSAGYPIERTNAGIQTQHTFWELAIPYTPPGAHWDAGVFFTQQLYDGLRDRQAVGLNARLLLPHASLTGLVDYDVYFKSLNAVALLGTMQLPARWSLSFDAEKRNAPPIGLHNALIGQPVTTIAELQLVATNDDILQWARDRTAETAYFSLTATRPIGQRFQFSTTVGASEVKATVASGGVPAQPASGLTLAFQSQIYGSNLWREGDFNVLSVAYSKTEVGKVASIGVTSRLPIGGDWRLGPRLSIDRRQLSSDGSTELSFIPSALLDFQRGRRLLQFEAGGQLGKRDATLQTQKTTRYYVSLAYRIGF
ncbi:MAG: SPOR domain-containing protein [Steroidobacteraceae bacterium]